jgi:anti-anti-sigma regulatory factor
MLVTINKKAEELKLKVPDLITRHVGRAMYESIRMAIENINDGETLLLDFTGIKVIDSSCIDEMIVRLILDSRKSKAAFYTKLKNVSEIAEINIDLVFRSYYSYKNKKIVVITENICQNNVFFIGPLSDQERDIVEFLRVNKSITADDAVTFTGLPREKVERIMDELDTIRVVKAVKGAYFAV